MRHEYGYFDDDVTARPSSRFADHNPSKDEEIRLRNVMHRRRDEIIDRLTDPALSPRDRERLEKLHDDVKTDLRKGGFGADAYVLRDLAKKWERIQI
ncbi:hypothetical protein [Bifidobacterium crudilactis]|uniref:hypothetical protein n=1 Tax=Bifidobacterium crudilactis TaxID=327277 RepID=UPI0026479897|nr:hypothetical protein [Bifidobacterium crudilactis]MDN5973029.1 hypothetical protein [Bifidobacterium crudilactis]MDN6000979.1 hypothetical protein [Bifidobacterium crudilactis]MDN6209195.1 hypothetical protein [Bifidobacterium crudilactis]MDN6234880.1 hypothetical protein [Bifidobacterium crudilactis]MDN6467687.1 hypothetical protein [Bifidobacterium crudilactis]